MSRYLMFPSLFLKDSCFFLRIIYMNLNSVARPAPNPVTGTSSEHTETRPLSCRGRPAVSRLDTITNWDMRAEQVSFNVAALAKGCGVTDRQLRRYFQSKFGSSPHAWLTLRRLQRAEM